MACLRNQQRASQAAAATGIAPLTSRQAYMAGATGVYHPGPLRSSIRRVAGVVLRYNLQRRYEWMVLTGRDPRMDKGDIAAMMLGTAIATAIILVRLKRRERRTRGQDGQENTHSF